MNYFMLLSTLIFIITIIILDYIFIKNIKEVKVKLKNKESEYNDLIFQKNKNEYDLVEKFNKNILLTKVTLKKIQKNYTARQYDKLVLIDFYHHLINYTKKDGLIYNIKLGKKYTYKEATNIILNYLNNDKPEKLDNVLSALLYIIFKA